MSVEIIERPEPQPILDPITEAAIFLVLTVKPGGEQAARALLSDIGGLRRAVGFRIPDATLSCVTAIGAELWDRLFAGPRPKHLHPFPGYHGQRHKAPATPGDLLFHIRAHRLDLCFELAGLIVQRLASAVKITDEVHGFSSFDQRDLLGFVDGTENPEGNEARQAVMIGAEDPDFAGGSYVIVQKYLHDLDAWQALPVAEQERVVGRTKLDNVELDDAHKPANSHVALNTIPDQAGNEPELLRLNMPFGHVGVSEYGTYFIGYANDPGVIEALLVNMFIGNPPGNTDRILDYSTAVTGCEFFVPSSELLDSLPAPAGAAAVPVSAAAAQPTPAGTLLDGSGVSVGANAVPAPDASEVASNEQPDAELPEGSLGIGSLREDPR